MCLQFWGDLFGRWTRVNGKHFGEFSAFFDVLAYYLKSLLETSTLTIHSSFHSWHTLRVSVKTESGEYGKPVQMCLCPSPVSARRKSGGMSSLPSLSPSSVISISGYVSKKCISKNVCVYLGKEKILSPSHFFTPDSPTRSCHPCCISVCLVSKHDE